MTERPRPILMKPDETLDVKSAADHAGRNDKTIRRWCSEFGIGRRPLSGGQYEVSLPGLEMVMHGDAEALELLRAGDRSAPAVRRYFDLLGLPE